MRPGPATPLKRRKTIRDELYESMIIPVEGPQWTIRPFRRSTGSAARCTPAAILPMKVSVQRHGKNEKTLWTIILSVSQNV